MINSSRRVLACGFAAALALSGCGAQDYPPQPQSPSPGQPAPGPGPAPEPTQPPQPPAAPTPTANAPATEKRLAPVKQPAEGYLWRGMRWVEVPDDAIEEMKCTIEDRDRVNYFQVVGTTLIAGAVLGIVVRGSGSWFFGEPIEPGPGHWFWNRLDKTLNTGREGIARGAAFAGFCSLQLAGASFWPIEGILGQNFSAVSSALSVGSLASIASAQPMSQWLETVFERLPARINRNRGAIYNGSVVLGRWSRRSELGRNVRHKIAPGIAIVGVGFGVGLLIYDHLQKGDPVECVPAEQESAQK